jgi:hypothetical protein
MLARTGGILLETHDELKTRVAPVARTCVPAAHCGRHYLRSTCFSHKHAPADKMPICVRAGTNWRMPCRDNVSYL